MAACLFFVVAAMLCPGASGDQGGCTVLPSGSGLGVSVWWTERLLDNAAVAVEPPELSPADDGTGNVVAVRRQHVNATLVLAADPVPFSTAQLRVVAFDPTVAAQLGIPAAFLRSAAAAEVFGDRRRLCGTRYFHHSYGGHQFGSWAGQLGDGRAVSAGVLAAPPIDGAGTDALRVPWEIAIKGAGPTPFSRRGDGRAVLQSNCREFLGSVALHALGIPTQRSLCVVAAGIDFDGIVRDEHYDGNAVRRTPGTVTRVAPSFFRFGTAQLAARRQGSARLVALARTVLAMVARLEKTDDTSFRESELVDAATRATCFGGRLARPSCAAAAADLDGPDVLRCLLERVSVRTGSLAAAWQAAGFAHGVLNTDNMSLLGITIDLNVFGFIDRWDPQYAPNMVDDEGRYAFGKQPAAVGWNVQMLARAFTGTRFTNDYQPGHATWMKEGGWLSVDRADAATAMYNATYATCYAARMRLRLGLPTSYGSAAADRIADRAAGRVVDRWIRFLDLAQPDYHIASRSIALLPELAFHPAGRRPSRRALLDTSLRPSDDSVIAAHDAFTAALGDHLFGLPGSGAATPASYVSGLRLPEWRSRVLQSVPFYVMRTAQSRTITRLAAEDGLDTLVEKARELLHSPFRSTPETNCVAVPVAPFDLASDGEAWVTDALAAAPGAAENGLQTSCGGQ